MKKKKTATLKDIPDEALDSVLAMPQANQVAYFAALVNKFYPKTEENSAEYVALLESYLSSFYLEKIYRSNNFLQEKYTIVYTNTGLIRELVLDLFYLDDSLVVH